MDKAAYMSIPSFKGSSTARAIEGTCEGFIKAAHPHTQIHRQQDTMDWPQNSSTRSDPALAESFAKFQLTFYATRQ